MGKRILIVADDVEMSRRVVRKFLDSEYEILEAEDGLQVMELLNTHPVDALLLDIIMPGMDGLQVLEHVRSDERLKNIGVLVASSTKEKTERTALSLGADDIVSKPYDPVVIQKRLENILNARAARAGQTPASGGCDAGLQDKTAELAAAMHRFADIIHENTDNPQLLLEVASQLHRKANLLNTWFSKPE